jgi:hypothetical protein
MPPWKFFNSHKTHLSSHKHSYNSQNANPMFFSIEILIWMPKKKGALTSAPFFNL